MSRYYTAKAKGCSVATLRNFWKAYDNFIFDADGVLWTGQKAIDGAPEVINKLIDAGKNVLILTNNSTRGLDQWVEKCHKLEFTGINRNHIVSSAMVCVHELKKLKSDPANPERSQLPIYLLGSKGLQDILCENGIDCFGVGPDPIENYTNDTFIFDIDLSRKPFAVVSSFDPHINYVKIMKAVNYLKDTNVHFIVTNEDLTFPGPNPNIVVPGAGTTSTILRAITKREPMVMGKPHHAAWDYICERFDGKLDQTRTLMIGDRCDTDISFGNKNGLDTLFVLSGISTIEDIDSYTKNEDFEMIPKFFTDSVKDMLV